MTTVEKTDFVTVVSVEAPKITTNKLQQRANENEPFVTVLSIGSGDKLKIDVIEEKPHIEKVNVYRLPGERLGFGLKFEGGTKSAECVKNLYIQSCAPESPASRVKASWGGLGEGDEIMAIGGRTVETMTRIDCVRALKDSPVVIELLVKRRPKRSENGASKLNDKKLLEPPPPPPIPPRKIPKRGNKNTGVVIPPKDFADKDDDKGKASPKRITSSPLVSQKNLSMKQRGANENGSIPPEAEVYLNLIAQEAEIQRTEYESDDTGSSISTIVDRLSSFPATSCSSICESTSIPSTPILGTKEMDKVLSPFELLEKEFATRFDSDLKKLNGISTPGKLSDEMLMLQPPENFQDAPLSYGDEEISDNTNDKNEMNDNSLDISLPSYENITINELAKLDGSTDEGQVEQEITSGPPKPLPRNLNSGVSRIPKRRAPPPPPPRNSKKDDNSKKKTKFNKIETWLKDTISSGDSDDMTYLENGHMDNLDANGLGAHDDQEEVTNIEDIEMKLEDDLDDKFDDDIEHLPRLIHFLPKISPLNTPICEKANPFSDDLDVNDEEIDNNNAIIKDTILNINNNTYPVYNLNSAIESKQMKHTKFTEPFFISRNYYDEEQHAMNNAFKTSHDSDGSSGSSEDELLIDIPEGPSEAYFTYWGGSQLPTIGEDEEEYSSLEASDKG